MLDSRAFAPLRRDEQRVWQRTPGGRDAYVAPALAGRKRLARELATLPDDTRIWGRR